MIGVPEGYHRVYPLPDQEDVEFPWSASIRADWISDDLVRQLLEEGPA